LVSISLLGISVRYGIAIGKREIRAVRFPKRELAWVIREVVLWGYWDVGCGGEKGRVFRYLDFSF
jgi:hypothetical protein